MYHFLNTSKLFSKYIFFTIIASLFTLVVYRAIHLSFTHDESLSYEIIKGNEGLKGTANYHFLNTFLMAYCSSLFGDSEISLRLPNVFSYIIYLFFCYLFLKSNPFLISIFIGVPLLWLNPYMIDFFSLARGYGISFAAMMGSTYFLLKENNETYWYKDFKKHFLLSMIWATIGLMANLTLLNFYLSTFGLFILQFIYYNIKKSNKSKILILQVIFLVIIFLIPINLAMLRLFDLKNNLQLYYGTDTFDNTLYSISIASFDVSAYVNGFPEALIKCAKLLYLVVICYSLITKGANKKILLLLGLLSIIILGLFLENVIFEAKFPYNRTAIYLAPLFGLLMYYFTIEIWLKIKTMGAKYALSSTLFFVSFIFLFNFFNKINLLQVGEQANDANIKDAVKSLVNHLKQNEPNAKKVSFAVNWIFYPSTKYYINTWHLPLEAIKIQNENDYHADYIYEFHENIKTPDKKLIKAFNITPTGLYKSQ